MSGFTRIRAAVVLSAWTLISSGMGTAAAAEQRQLLNPAKGFHNYLNGYAPINVVKDGRIITVSGMIAGKQNAKWDLLATLPTGMRPAKRLIFNLNIQDNIARVDVLPNGRIEFVAGNTGWGWLSLDGISFSTGKGTALQLTTGWRNYAGDYAPASTIKNGNIIMVSGLVGAGPGKVVVTLPSHLRPKKMHIFNLNSHDRTLRVEVHPNGRVVWVAPAPTAARNWVSLNGITFQRRPGRPLNMVNGWRNYGGGYAPATVARIGNRISVSGLIKGSKWGHVATLPPGMCPARRLIFNLNNHDRTSRVDVWPDCRIVWSAGGQNHGWINLDGISFYTGKPGTPPKPVSQVASIPWVKVPGGLVEISVGANGSVWGLGTDKVLYRYVGNLKGRWTRMLAPGAVRIAVEPGGAAWVVKANNGIFRYNGRRWKPIPSAALDIGIGANGAVWMIATNKYLYRWDGKSWGGSRAMGYSGQPVRVVVDSKGNPWMLNNKTSFTDPRLPDPGNNASKKFPAGPLISASAKMARSGSSTPMARSISGMTRTKFGGNMRMARRVPSSASRSAQRVCPG